jgi:hypothetical protein
MSLTISCFDAARLMKTVEGLGGEAPPAITAILNTMTSVKGSMTGGTNFMDLMERTFRRAASDEQGLDVKEARALAKQTAESMMVGAHLSQSIPELDLRAAMIIQEMLSGQGGEDLLDSLGDGVDGAIGVIREAVQHYGPETKAEDLIALGGAAVDAWNRAGEAGAYLDRVVWEVLRPLTLEWRVFPDETYANWFGQQLLATWWIDPAKAYALEDVGSLFTRPLTHFKVPGGRWLEVYQLANGLRLNGPKQATEILSALLDYVNEQNAARFPKVMAEPDIGFSEDVNE